MSSTTSSSRTSFADADRGRSPTRPRSRITSEQKNHEVLRTPGTSPTLLFSTPGVCRHESRLRERRCGSTEVGYLARACHSSRDRNQRLALRAPDRGRRPHSGEGDGVDPVVSEDCLSCCAVAAEHGVSPIDIGSQEPLAPVGPERVDAVRPPASEALRVGDPVDLVWNTGMVRRRSPQGEQICEAGDHGEFGWMTASGSVE